MTDKQSLLTYRLTQARETVSDAERMLKGNISLRSVINRAYYAMFYAVLALFLKTDINVKTSKHAGIISVFNKEFVHTGKIDKCYSKTLHKIFDLRQSVDYKEFIAISKEDASESVNSAREFLSAMEKFIEEG